MRKEINLNYGKCSYVEYSTENALFPNTGNQNYEPVFLLDILDLPSSEALRSFLRKKWKKEKDIEKIVAELGKYEKARIVFHKIVKKQEPKEVCNFISQNSEGKYACKIWLGIIDMMLKNLCQSGVVGRFNTGQPIVILSRPVTEECIQMSRKLARLKRYHDKTKSRHYIPIDQVGNVANIVVTIHSI